MRNLVVIVAGLFLVVAFTGCKKEQPVKSIENLTAAFNGESTASAKYAKFAQKAREEGFDTIAVMFEATSKAEAVHAGNHKKALEKYGATVGDPVIGEFVVATTAENLADAIKGESYEIATMYPDFIAAAETEGAKDAKKSFTWALDTEKKHEEFYQRALAALIDGGESSLPVQWFVCPVCGNTYDAPSMKEECDFCRTKKEKFFVF